MPYAGAILYAMITPLGIAIGLGFRTTFVSFFSVRSSCSKLNMQFRLNSYDPNSETANIVSGVLDALSAGILIYTGLVELLAHDFIFNREMAVEVSYLFMRSLSSFH